jgi:superfamily I DNA/RNA helicase/RecB family exonuclease
VLDADQQAVVDHRGGPLLVLAGPGTGKTTTLVEAVVARVRDGLPAEQVLVLTFSRKAAQELRQRISARLALTTRGPVAMTFHSYAYALLRRELGGAPPRLLTGPEQDLEVRRLLLGQLEDGATIWPAELRAALALRGFRTELRDVLGRAQERGLGPDDLRARGEAAGRPEWVAAGDFLADYEARFDLDPLGVAIDQSGLVQAAAELLQVPRVRAAERDAHRVVFVDEVQDADPAQLRMLLALAGDGRDLVAVGDPDQSIYAFRGADVRGVLDFGDRFRTVAGEPARRLVLRTCRRSGVALLAAGRAVASRLPAGALDPGFRDLVPDEAVVAGPGSVDVRLATSAAAEAAVVADVLRRAHLHDGVGWSEMAVLVRSTARALPALRRGLVAAGVPVAVPPDEVPLVQQPLVQGLLDLVRIGLAPEDRPPGVEEVLGLLSGPLVRLDALAVRRLRRVLRAGDPATPSDELLVAAVTDPHADLLDPPRELRHVHRLLGAVRATPGTVEDVLWAAWQASGLERRLAEDSARGGTHGAVADAALDAVIALFDAAGRYVDRLPFKGAAEFALDLQGQEIPADTLAARTPEGDAVRVMTAHASKGLEWRLVVVAGVQEGAWPDLRLRGSLLGADDLAAGDGPEPPALERRQQLLAEERRLFYVAVTRARERLVVTAVAAGEGDDERPSRFVAELGVAVPEVPTVVRRPLTTGGLLAELRHAAAHAEDPALREVAARRLAALVRQGVPHADPSTWWGTAELSDDRPLVGEDETVRVSPSRVEAFDTCQLRWLLESAVGLAGTSGPKQMIGNLLHALAELGAGEGALDDATLVDRLDAALPKLDLGAPWAAVQLQAKARASLLAFLAWQRANPRELVGTELEVAVPFGDRAVISGRVDRLERDDQGRGIVVDIKTGTPPAGAEVPRHPQLGVYQLAVALGAFKDLGISDPGGAMLLQLKDRTKAGEQVQPALADADDPGWAEQLVSDVVAGMSGSTFLAVVNDRCERACPVRSSCPAHPDGDGVVR